MFNLNVFQALNSMKEGKHIISNYKRIYYMNDEKQIRICDENRNLVRTVDVEFFLKLKFIKFKEIA